MLFGCCMGAFVAVRPDTLLSTISTSLTAVLHAVTACAAHARHAEG